MYLKDATTVLKDPNMEEKDVYDNLDDEPIHFQKVNEEETAILKDIGVYDQEIYDNDQCSNTGENVGASTQ